jgi:hypothetical protein
MVYADFKNDSNTDFAHLMEVRNEKLKTDA